MPTALLIVAWYTLASLLAGSLHWSDNRRARSGRRRIRERTLHLVELAGGWPGATVVRRRLRHKTAKRSYRLVFGVIVAVHLIGWSALAGLWIARLISSSLTR